MATFSSLEVGRRALLAHNFGLDVQRVIRVGKLYFLKLLLIQHKVITLEQALMDNLCVLFARNILIEK